ncbi:class I SAM-dependent methyltransferase [Tumebacillus lipolyticus]|uniref:Class I SAM-dependent methyltransferase n=1 Tax=Tumebacillus lipolyticus TaxID=1280370 RepID=A0ABW4ZY59_9BACL
MTELARWIREQIEVEVRVPFARFMEWALYHPELGYYTGEKRKFGKAGDFYTSPGINPVFAEVLADQLAEKAEQLGEGTISLIEFGAGEGMLARDVLDRWQSAHPVLYERVDYRIVEISPSLQQVQQEMTAAHSRKLSWTSEAELAAGAPYRGAVLTNEFVDAFPVHRVVQTKAGYAELYVAWDRESNSFVETPAALSDHRLHAYLARYAPEMMVGQVTEVGLAGLDWYERACSLLANGSMITIDYGFDAQMLHHKSRRNGTLRGFFQHRLIEDPFANIGLQDLTTDVNFTALQELGERAAGRTEFYGSQSSYLLQAGILNRLQDVQSADLFRDPVMKRNRAIKQLILPGGIGDHFKVLVQGF